MRLNQEMMSSGNLADRQTRRGGGGRGNFFNHGPAAMQIYWNKRKEKGSAPVEIFQKIAHQK